MPKRMEKVRLADTFTQPLPEGVQDLAAALTKFHEQGYRITVGAYGSGDFVSFRHHETEHEFILVIRQSFVDNDIRYVLMENRLIPQEQGAEGA